MLAAVFLARAWAPVVVLGTATALLAASVLLVLYGRDSAAGLAAAATSACLALPLLVVGLYCAYLLACVFRIYIQVSDEGIEYRYAPHQWVRATWADVDHIGEYRSFFGNRTQVLWLHRAEYPGRLKRPPYGAKQPFVALAGFRGWPDGPLADDLRGRAPELFRERERVRSR
jgi:hypothetical protein